MRCPGRLVCAVRPRLTDHDILHRCLDPLLQSIHRTRLATLFAAVAACVSGPALSLTDVGRRFGGTIALRDKIKRADRLLGNRHRHREAKSIYQTLCRVTRARVREPLILIDWSDLKADQSLHLLRASLPVGGRSLTLYEEVHPQKKLNNAAVHARFLRHLSTLIPPGAAPIVIADAGFKVPFHREVEALGWRWVGRVRGRDFVCMKARWTSCKTLFKRATATPTALGEGEWVRSNPLRAVFALVRRAPKGRRGKTAFGKRARSKASTQNARSAKEPWLPGASTRFADWPAKRLVRLYAQRMQIEIYQTWCLHKSLRQVDGGIVAPDADMPRPAAGYIAQGTQAFDLGAVGPNQPCLSGCLPLHLQRWRRAGWVNPGALVDSGIGRPSIPHSNSENRVERSRRPEPTIEPEDELVEVSLKMLGADPMMCAEEPSIKVAKDNVDHREVRVRYCVVPTYGNTVVDIPGGLEWIVSGPTISTHNRPGLHGRQNERGQRFLLPVCDDLKPESPRHNTPTMPPLADFGSAFRRMPFRAAPFGSSHACPLTKFGSSPANGMA